jgi:CheY-like chemotaxis protein
MKRSLQIAVADDEPDMRDYLKAVLERLGHEVLGPVENGRQLVDLCREHMPDLVITDIRMAKLSGDEALREIWAMHPVRCLVVSAYENSAQCTFPSAGGGGCAFLAKPFRKNDLYDAITRLMTS